MAWHVVPREDLVAGEGGGLHRAHLVVRKTRSEPPPLTSNEGPRRSSEIAVHSMPGRTPRAEDVVRPGRLAGTLGAPQQGVEPAPLPGSFRVAAAVGEHGIHLLGRPAGDVAERGRLRQVEVDVTAAVLTLRDGEAVCRAGREQRPHRDRDLVHRLHDPDERVGREHREGRHVLAEEVDLGGGELAPVPPVTGRALEERVVDVGDVLDVLDAVAGARSARPTRSKVTYVAAWPRWVAS